MNQSIGKVTAKEMTFNTLQDDLLVAYREIALLQEQIAFDDELFPQVEDLEDE